MKRFSYRTKKICALVGSAAIQLCVGIIYIWSIFRVPVMEYLGWDSAKASLTFSIMFPLNMAGVIAGGLLCDRIGHLRVIGAGGALAVAGLLLASLVTKNSAALLYVFYSGMCGIGGGLCYAAAIVNANRWWPERKGLATGITVGAYGCSTVLFGALVDFILSTRLGVSGTFRLLAFVFFIVFALAAIPMRLQPAAECAAETEEKAVRRSLRRQYSPGEVLASPRYYLLLACMICVTAPYLMLNASIKSFGIARGLNVDVALLAVMLTGVASMAGRLISAWLTDKVSVYLVVCGLLCVMFTAMGVLSVAGGAGFIVALSLVAFAFGGGAGITPILASFFFGERYMSSNMGLLMVSAVAGGIVFPALAVQIGENGLPSQTTFLVAEILEAAGLVLLFMIYKLDKKRNASLPRG